MTPSFDLVSAAMVLALCAVGPAFVVYENWSTLADLKSQWSISGPGCAPISEIPARLISRRHPPKAFRYADAAYVHATGLASCADLAETPLWPGGEHFSVCQFNNPGAVTVSTPAGTSTYLAPPGHRLTITVRRAHAGCVVGGWFSL